MKSNETVAELIARLQKLPPNLPVYRNWEGSLRADVRVAEEFVLIEGDYARVDYVPEASTDEGEIRIQAVIIG